MRLIRISNLLSITCLMLLILPLAIAVSSFFGGNIVIVNAADPSGLDAVVVTPVTSDYRVSSSA